METRLYLGQKVPGTSEAPGIFYCDHPCRDRPVDFGMLTGMLLLGIVVLAKTFRWI
jgi:hypothetical protein